MKRMIVFLFLSGTCLFSFAQEGIGYYHDPMNNFYVFDNGIEHRIETMPVSGIQAGNDYLCYTDSKLSFMYYYMGDKQLLEENFPNKIVATRTALVYKMQQRLMIVQKGEKKMLARNAEQFIAADSIVMWQSWPSMDYMAYENGEIKTVVAANNSSDAIKDYKAESNIIAFNDLNYNLKIYYKGKIYDTESDRVASYGCGHNIVAFVDEYKNTFNVFYEGEFKVLSNEIIKEYKVSNDMVAFIDAKENFYIFYNGGLTKIASRKPEYYNTYGNILVYSYDSKLKIIYEGTIHTQYQVDPASLRIGYNSLLYYVNVNSPKYFFKGQIYDRFYVQKPYTMSINSDLPVFYYNNTIGFLTGGKISEYGVRANSGSNSPF